MDNKHLEFEFVNGTDSSNEDNGIRIVRRLMGPVGLTQKPMSEYEIAALEVGRLVKEKNKAYGSSFLDAAKIMAILYPDGIRPDQYEDATVMVRVIDKLKRVATDNDPYGEDPWEDITGYGLLSRVRRTHKRKETTRADLSRE